MHVEIQPYSAGIQLFTLPCYAVSGVFSRHYRKVKAIFGATDVLLTSLAFFAAYQTRIRLHLEKQFLPRFSGRRAAAGRLGSLLDRDRLLVQHL